MSPSTNSFWMSCACAGALATRAATETATANAIRAACIKTSPAIDLLRQPLPAPLCSAYNETCRRNKQNLGYARPPVPLGRSGQSTLNEFASAPYRNQSPDLRQIERAQRRAIEIHEAQPLAARDHAGRQWIEPHAATAKMWG